MNRVHTIRRLAGLTGALLASGSVSRQHSPPAPPFGGLI
jgi:hypothetical protein